MFISRRRSAAASVPRRAAVREASIALVARSFQPSRRCLHWYIPRKPSGGRRETEWHTCHSRRECGAAGTCALEDQQTEECSLPLIYWPHTNPCRLLPIRSTEMPTSQVRRRPLAHYRSKTEF